MLASLGLEPVVNAVGPATRLGSSTPGPHVLAAMAEAAGAFVRMHELQAAAGAEIAAICGAEAGYVTNGAAGGLMLAAAACIAGDDPALMDRLPDASGARDEIVIHRGQRIAYDHALRAAGARLVEIGFHDLTFPRELDAAIGERTAAVAYLSNSGANAIPLEQVVAIAHRRGVPVILDASLAVPPVANLRRFAALGVDLVAVSGGKWIGGPAASGFLYGRADLIRSVALQHQDQDVRMETWHGAPLVAEGIVPGPPHQGIGRALKVGKEEIAGLLAALRAWVARDHDADRARWTADCETVVAALDGIDGVRAEVLPADGRERGWPVAEIALDERALGRTAYDVVRELAAGTPSIALDEALAWRGLLRVTPTQLQAGEAEVVATSLAASLRQREAAAAIDTEDRKDWTA
nr:aminotransferase class V-fold PLP-dependent enzyme [Conexibacter arvalis]